MDPNFLARQYLAHSCKTVLNGVCFLPHYDLAVSVMICCVPRLRKKWSDALMNRREYLDTEVRKIMEKREPNVAGAR